MKKFRLVVPMLVAVLVLLVSGISVYAGDVAKIDINKASAEELTQLKGVGTSIAAKIVEYREKNGPFKTPEDITLVSGIGAKTYENNKGVIVVE